MLPPNVSTAAFTYEPRSSGFGVELLKRAGDTLDRSTTSPQGETERTHPLCSLASRMDTLLTTLTKSVVSVKAITHAEVSLSVDSVSGFG